MPDKTTSIDLMISKAMKKKFKDLEGEPEEEDALEDIKRLKTQFQRMHVSPLTCCKGQKVLRRAEEKFNSEMDVVNIMKKMR